MSTPIRILLVEDNPGDVELMRVSLRRSRYRTELTVACDGVEAMQKLTGEGGDSSAALPDMIILDLNMPRKDGRQVLAELRAEPLLRPIPVLVLTSSASDSDITNSYELGANCFLTKPLDLIHFERVVRSIEEFWFKTARLPHNKSAT